MKIEYNYKNGLTVCIITNKKGQKFSGYASCHDDDLDMQNEKTGKEIARQRAMIEIFKCEKYNIKEQLKSLRHFASVIKRSKQFNPNSYENKMLRRQIQGLEIDLDTVQSCINLNKSILKDYIEKKEEFYQKVRKRRKDKSK